MKLVGQMMTGLPGADSASETATARDICAWGADAARVYPTVVFRGTELEAMAAAGGYEPLDYDTAAERTASVLDVFDRAGVPVIRVGLCAGEGLTSPDTVAGGANHPAMGELAMGELFYRRICKAADDAVASFDAPLAGQDHDRVGAQRRHVVCRGAEKTQYTAAHGKILHSGRHKSCNCA